jgi:hypothetical protein
LSVVYSSFTTCSLIIAVKFQPLPILQQCLNLLYPSSHFVVFSEFMEPLIECYLYLYENSLAVRLVLSDTWMREFQTLPGRVHPEMFMSTSGGFLLTGVYVGMPAGGNIIANPECVPVDSKIASSSPRVDDVTAAAAVIDKKTQGCDDTANNKQASKKQRV